MKVEIEEVEPPNLIKVNFKPREIGQCEHVSLMIGDHGDDSVTCQSCKKEINPFEALRILCRSESRLRYRCDELKKLRQKIDAKSKVKCRHCWKMTPVVR